LVENICIAKSDWIIFYCVFLLSLLLFTNRHLFVFFKTVSLFIFDCRK